MNIAFLEEKETELRALGCLDHGCVIAKPKGQGTNSRCRCLEDLPFELRRKVGKALRLRKEQVTLLSELLKVSKP